MKHAVVIGNGLSRKGLKLKKIKSPTFGCNRIVDEFHPTYVIAIDPPMIEMLWKTDYPQHRIIAPPEGMRWEPPQLHNGARIRSNAGCNAIIEAMARGFNHISLVGFDFLIQDDEAKVANVFAGKEGYFTISPEEATRRNVFFNFIVSQSPDILFNVVFPRNDLSKLHKLPGGNIFSVAMDDWIDRECK